MTIIVRNGPFVKNPVHHNSALADGYFRRSNGACDFGCRTMTILALLRPIQSWGQLAVGIIFLVAIPTALVLLIDYLDGGLGNKVGTEALYSVMIGSAWRGVVEELLFRGVIPSFVFLMALRRRRRTQPEVIRGEGCAGVPVGNGGGRSTGFNLEHGDQVGEDQESHCRLDPSDLFIE